jgi:lysophospholipase L1-like esterase
MSFTRRVLFVSIALVVVVIGIELLLRVAGGILMWNAGRKLASSAGDGPSVLAIGESTTGGLGVEPELSYPKQLEKILREHYALDTITVVAPWAMGQNSSQQLHRIDRYLSAYKPRLVLLMCGVNNPWSFAESNITDFIDGDDPVLRRIRFRLFADRFRIVKVLRLALMDLESVIDDLSGRPEEDTWPPSSTVYDWSLKHRPDFLALWRNDVGSMIRAASDSGAMVALMTYPTYKFPPPEEFRSLADEYGIPLIEIHRAFEEYLEAGEENDILLEDGYHPNPLGYQILAEQVFLFIVARDALSLNNARVEGER